MTMPSYNGFAYIYDQLIDQDYEKWADYLEEIFAKYQAKPELVLDLGCGTGCITTLLAERGYDMIGVDLSADMLAVAAEKAAEKELDIRYLCQDMTSFELYGTVDAVICTMDAVNYLTSLEKLQKTFALVKNYLNPGGLFIFDISTEYRLKTVLGDNSFIFDAGGVFYTWENHYNPRTKITTQNLTFFVEEETGYQRIDEVHRQRAFSCEEIVKFLEKAGLEFLNKYDVFTFCKPGESCEKAVFIAKSFC